MPTHTRRSETSLALQQFSTPPGLAFVASTAAAIHPGAHVLEPSAGTVMLAVHALLARAGITLNALGETRAELLRLLFPAVPVSGHYDASLDHRLLSPVPPTVVLLHPPFSAL